MWNVKLSPRLPGGCKAIYTQDGFARPRNQPKQIAVVTNFQSSVLSVGLFDALLGISI